GVAWQEFVGLLHQIGASASGERRREEKTRRTILAVGITGEVVGRLDGVLWLGNRRALGRALEMPRHPAVHCLPHWLVVIVRRIEHEMLNFVLRGHLLKDRHGASDTLLRFRRAELKSIAAGVDDEESSRRDQAQYVALFGEAQRAG